jgi:hypothetical protein
MLSLSNLSVLGRIAEPLRASGIPQSSVIGIGGVQ